MKTLKINLIVLLLLTINLVHSQEKEKSQMKQVQAEKVSYACPMHCEGEKTYDKPGSCPKCNMDLTKVEMKMAEIYTCPMHADVTSDKPGTCPKCKMDLKKVTATKSPQCCAGMKTDSAKMECDMNHDKMAEMYVCPMHSDIKSGKPGACPKCKMDLKKMEIKKEK